MDVRFACSDDLVDVGSLKSYDAMVFRGQRIRSCLIPTCYPHLHLVAPKSLAGVPCTLRRTRKHQEKGN
jgi:hypothetical protein